MTPPERYAARGEERPDVLFALDRVVCRLGSQAIPNEEGWSLTVERGSRLVVLGRSGSGKTTLLHVLGLLSPASSGTVRLFPSGAEPLFYAELHQPANRSRLQRARRSHFGFVFQDDHLLENLSTGHNLALPLLLRGLDRAVAEVRVQQLAARFFDGEVDSILRRNPSDLSGGQRSRVALMRGMVADPEVLFLDEPFTYLDNEQCLRAMRWLEEWQRHADPAVPRTIVLVTHDLASAARLATHFLVIAPDRRVIFAPADHVGASDDRLEWLLEILPDE